MPVIITHTPGLVIHAPDTGTLTHRDEEYITACARRALEKHSFDRWVCILRTQDADSQNGVWLAGHKTIDLQLENGEIII